MHNLIKIRLFRLLLAGTYLPALFFILPFALLKRRGKGRYFFFFDRYAIGGAQRVHIDILNSIAGKHKQVYFTRYSPNDKLKQDFYTIPNTTCLDIHFWCDNLLFRLFTVHFFAFYLNRHKDAVVFSSNSTFFYDTLFFLGKRLQKVELLHNFTYGNNGMEFFGLGNYKYLDYRMVVDGATKKNIAAQYKEYNVPEAYNDRVIMIEPGVIVPQTLKKDYSLPLKILYAGRGGAQKRIGLLNEIAEQAINKKLPVEFHFAGTMMDELSVFVRDHSVIHGEITSQEAMYYLYHSCHVILMTSSYEGFPMLVKEGMANGCIPVVTALEGNKTHLHHKENALLIEHPEDGVNVVRKGLAYIEQLASDMDYTSALSKRCYEYARQRFDKAAFIAMYREFLT